MADYSVSMDGSNSFSVSVERTIVADRLSDLSDVSATDLGNKDQYVLVYDASQQKYKLVNPDVVLNAAASTETNQPGLVGYATAFLDRMDVDLDNKIDLDAGTF
jgi:hypothetical protein